MNPPTIYLNACSQGTPDLRNLERMIRHLEAEAEHGPQRAVDACAAELDLVRHLASNLLGTDRTRTGWCTGTAATWQRIVGLHARTAGRVVVSAYEWGDHVRYLRDVLSHHDVLMDVVPASETFDPQAWAARLDEDVLAMSIPLVTSVDGLALPVASVGALPRPEGTLLILDAAQGLGRVPIPPGAFGCDAVIATTRKWVRAPRQTAVFALSARAERVLGSTARDLEPIDRNAALHLGLGMALMDLAQSGLPVQRHSDLARGRH